MAMNDDNASDHSGRAQGSFWMSRFGMVLLVFLVIGGLFLVYEHRMHLLNGDLFPILLLLVCIGMHLFMHRGHGGHGGGSSDGGGQS
jgi:heme/copper-type cytochrome/quinol oxidase subunit 4